MDGLVSLVTQLLAVDPFACDALAFRAKRADRLKLRLWGGAGLCLGIKRLEASRLTWRRCRMEGMCGPTYERKLVHSDRVW